MKYLYIYLIIINAAGFLLMLIDKQKAKKRAWRIPELVLIGTAIIGGSIGTLVGMEVFRHKTKHVRFSVGVPVIIVLQLIVVAVILLLTGVINLAPQV